MRGVRAVAVAVALATATLVACSSSPRPSSPSPDARASHAAPVRRACMGVHRDDVVGRPPSYVADRPLARFPNDTAICSALWLPTADRGFVPQGVALDGRTAWVSGYRWRRSLGQRACHLLHVSLRTGRLLDSTERLVGRIGQGSETFCRHGGAVTLDRHGLWVVESNRLWLVDPDRVGHADQVRRVWFVDRPVRGSVLVDGGNGEIGVGAWNDQHRGRMHWFRTRDLLAPGVTNLRASGSGAFLAPAVRASSTVRRVQGSTPGPGPGPGVAAGIWSSSSTSTCGTLVTPGGRRVAFSPGAEGIALAGRGRLWVALESGSRHYQRAGRPLTPMLAEYDVRQLLHGRRPSCGW